MLLIVTVCGGGGEETGQRKTFRMNQFSPPTTGSGHQPQDVGPAQHMHVLSAILLAQISVSVYIYDVSVHMCIWIF